MPFKFPLPGPLKGKLLPGEGLDGDRLRAGLGSGLGFRGWVLRGLQKKLRFGAGLVSQRKSAFGANRNIYRQVW